MIEIEPLTDAELDEIEADEPSPLIRRFLATVRDLQAQTRELDDTLDALTEE